MGLRFIRVVLVFISFWAFSQTDHSLVLKIQKNQEFMKSEMDKGFLELKKLEKEAISTNNVDAQLEALNNKAFYYFTKAEYNKSYQIAKQLEDEATKNNNIRLQAIAKNRIGVTLNFLQAYDDSAKKLKEAETFINKHDFENKNLILANNYQFQSDYYTHILNHKLAAVYVKKTIPQYQKIKDAKERQIQLAKGNSNIGLKYLSLNLDSAAYFFKKSLELQDNVLVKNFNVANYVGLGEVANGKGNYDESITYLKKAEELNQKVQDGFYMTSIYELMQDSYKKLGNEKEYNKYNVLYLENLRIENEEKLSGVNTLVKEVRAQSDSVIQDNKKKSLIFTIFIIIVTLSSIFLFYLIKNFKNKNKEKEIIEKELAIKEKHIENLEVKVSDLHQEVIQMAKENDVNFYTRFLDLYPDFEQKLLAIDPSLSISELQFCALLKLNFSSKDISNYTFTSIRTVQNKKYRIRNKLNIPNQIDTYIFINNL